VLGGGANFEALVSHLLSGDDSIRKPAEDLFEKSKEQPDALATNLIAVLRQSQLVEHRIFAAVMLRKVLGKDDPPLLLSCNQQVQALVQKELLASLKDETQKTVVKKVCHAVAELGAAVSEQNGWPDLLPFLFQMIHSPQPDHIESALIILGNLASFMIDGMRPHLDQLVQVLGQCLSHANKDVQLAALAAASAFIQVLEEPAERDKFQHMILPMLATLGNTLNSGDEAAAQEALEMFIEVAEYHPRFLRKSLDQVVSAMMSVTRADSLEAATRTMAAEFLVTLCEARDKAPGMMRKLPNFAGSLFETCMLFLLDVEDDPLWHNADSDQHEEAGSGDLYEAGQENLDRISIALGGNAIVPAAGTLLPQFLQDADWKKRHATLICLAQIAEGCAKVMSKQLGPLVDMCVKGLQDPHPKVRWAACQALGQMCTDLGPDLQNSHHAKILPALMAVMEDFNAPRVQAHACAAVVNFSEGADADMLPPYLDHLISKLLGLLQHGKKTVQESALTAMASVADCSQALFIKYYEVVMPLLYSILIGAIDKAHRLLRAKALECISLVGMAVGKDRFREDAMRVMQYLQQLQGMEMDSDDPTSSYMLQAGARICKCLGKEFLPYLNIVMPSLLKSAQIEPDVKVRDYEEDDGDEDEDDADVERIQIGDKTITLRTSMLEEKATACNMLCCYADELKEGFLPWVEQVTEIMVPLLKFWYHEEVRRAAAQTLPELLRSTVLAHEKGMLPNGAAAVDALLNRIWGPMIDILNKEPDVDVQSALLDSVSEMVELVEPTMLKPEWVEHVFKKFSHILTSAEERRQERLKRREAEDFDVEDLQELEEENQQEEELFDQVGACIGTFLKKFGDSVLGYVESIMGQIAPLLDKSRSAEDRRIAVCVVDDLLEHSPAGRAKYAGQVIPVLLEACTDPNNADLRQCSVYGLGVLAAKAPELFRPICNDSLQRIMAIMNQPNARDDDNEMATENAISALGKILEFSSEGIDANAVAGAWLAALPLTCDRVEAQQQHHFLVRLLEAGDVRILGQGNANLTKIVAILVRVLGDGTRLIEGEVGRRAAALLHQMQGNVPADAVQGPMMALTAKQQANLQVFMSGQIPASADD